jgi:hypothetical protein
MPKEIYRSKFAPAVTVLLVLGWLLPEISAGIPAILTKVFHASPQFFKESVQKVFKIRP